jgi:hypothetical protein
MQVGKTRTKNNDQSILIRKDGKWLVKSMMEAGWGDLPAPGAQPAPAAPAAK